MKHLDRTFRRLILLVFLVGCSAGGTSPSMPSVSGGALSKSPHNVTWGIGASGLISTDIPQGLVDRHYEKTFCQVKKSCPLFTFGKRSSSFTGSKTSAWADGTFSVDNSASSALGQFAFHHFVSSTSGSSHVFQGVEAITTLAWTDTLTITSAALPYGTPASFKVTTTVSPSAMKAPCNKYDVEALNVQFLSNELVGKGNTVYANCIGGKFIFFVNKASQLGKVAVNTMKGTVGQSPNIQGMALVTSALCIPTGCIPQSSTLTGTVKYTIEPTTPGVSFKTASGTKYK